MNRQRVVPADALPDEILPPLHLSVDEGAVLLMVDVGDLPGTRKPGFLDENGDQTVKARPHFLEDDPQAAGVVKEIVRIAEHHIFRCGIIETGVSGRRHSPVRFFIILDGKRVAPQQRVREEYIGAVIADDNPNLIEGDVLLEGDAVQERLDDLIRFLVLRDENLQFH